MVLVRIIILSHIKGIFYEYNIWVFAVNHNAQSVGRTRRKECGVARNIIYQENKLPIQYEFLNYVINMNTYQLIGIY